MLPDAFGSDYDHDTAMGHGPEEEREPYIRVDVLHDFQSEPIFCLTWEEAWPIIARFGDGWSVLVHVGSWDVEVSLIPMPTEAEIAQLAAGFWSCD